MKEARTDSKGQILLRGESQRPDGRNGLVDYRMATVNDLYETWLEQKRGIRKNTLYNYRRAIHRAVMAYNCKMKGDGADNLMLPPITSHAFRKTFLTRMCEAGMNVRDIMQIAGHADIQTTMSVYTKVTERMKKADLEKLEEYVKNIGSE